MYLIVNDAQFHIAQRCLYQRDNNIIALCLL